MQLNTNIKERLEILGNLHWRLLHALNAAEEVFRDKELPEMEEQARNMRKQIKVCTHHHISLGNELAWASWCPQQSLLTLPASCSVVTSIAKID